MRNIVKCKIDERRGGNGDKVDCVVGGEESGVKKEKEVEDG